MLALQKVFPDVSSDEAPPRGAGRLNYPRPISEPPSPTSTRAHSPISSLNVSIYLVLQQLCSYIDRVGMAIAKYLLLKSAIHNLKIRKTLKIRVLICFYWADFRKNANPPQKFSDCHPQDRIYVG